MTVFTWFAGPPDGRPIEICSHRTLRGPYTGAGTLLRALVPEMMRHDPQAVRAQAVELVSIAPELAGVVESPTLTVPQEPYPASRTRWLARGAIAFLLRRTAAIGPLNVTFTHVDQADPTDHEFLALLVALRGDARLGVTVRSRTERLPEALARALARHTMPGRALDTSTWTDARSRSRLLKDHILADGVSTDPTELAAYAEAAPWWKTAMHRSRAENLLNDGEWSARLGAIPYHLERSGDRDAAVDALMEALCHCFDRGFYEAVVDYALRIRALAEPHMEQYWPATAKAATSLTLLGRPDEARPLRREPRARTALGTAAS